MAIGAVQNCLTAATHEQAPNYSREQPYEACAMGTRPGDCAERSNWTETGLAGSTYPCLCSYGAVYTDVSVAPSVDAKVWGSWSRLGPFGGPTTMLSPQSQSGLTLARCDAASALMHTRDWPRLQPTSTCPKRLARSSEDPATTLARPCSAATPPSADADQGRVCDSCSATSICAGTLWSCTGKRWSTLLTTRPQKGHSLEHAA